MQKKKKKKKKKNEKGKRKGRKKTKKEKNFCDSLSLFICAINSCLKKINYGNVVGAC